MKKSAFIVGIGLILAGILGNATCHAQWEPAKEMAQTMVAVLKLGKKIETNSNLGFCNTCYLGASIEQGNNSWMTTTLVGGKQYIFAGASRKGTDLDIILENEVGDTVAKDTQSDNIPLVRFTPKRTGAFTIRLKLHSSSKAEFCGMVLMEEGGWSLPTDNLADAAAKVLTRCERISKKKSTRFLKEAGEWSIIGGVLKNSEEQMFTDLRLGSGNRVVLTSGDKKSRDLDLTVYRDSLNLVHLASDTLEDDYPLVQLRTRGDHRYGVKMSNANSNGATIVMTAILDVK